MCRPRGAGEGRRACCPFEQRIGRCYRYGQRFDVVVINFLNTRNQADQRVLELLTEKFNLFSGVFGASDEVLGCILAQ